MFILTVWELKFHTTHPDNLFSCSEDGSVWHWDRSAASAYSNVPNLIAQKGEYRQFRAKHIKAVIFMFDVDTWMRPMVRSLSVYPGPSHLLLCIFQMLHCLASLHFRRLF